MSPRITVLVFLLCFPAAFSALDSGPLDATSIQKPPSRGRRSTDSEEMFDDLVIGPPDATSTQKPPSRGGRSVDSEEMLDDVTEEMFDEKDIYRLAETGR